MALVYGYQIIAHGLSLKSTMARAKDYARRATVLDDRNPTVQAHAGLAYLFCCEHQLSRQHAERAVALNPNDSYALFVMANVLTYSGELDEALKYFARSERLEAYAPDDMRLDFLCDCHYLSRNYDKVVEIHRVYKIGRPFSTSSWPPPLRNWVARNRQAVRLRTMSICAPPDMTP